MTKSLGIGRGGRREGAGRPRGATTKRQRPLAIEKKARIEGLELPLDRLLRRMNDAALPEDYRDQLATMAAPYLHPRLSAVSVHKRASQMSQPELDQLEATLKEDLLRAGIGRGAWPRPVH